MAETCRSTSRRQAAQVGLGYPGWAAGVLLGWSLLAGALPAGAATVESAIDVDAWGERDGLPQGTVTSIVRDRDGYLWTGTFAGLFRFSGTEFEEQVAPPELYARVARVTALDEGADGLWIGVEDGGVWCLVDGAHRAVPQPDALRSATVWTIQVLAGVDDAHEEVLVGASTGLWRRRGDADWERLTDQAAVSVLAIGDDAYWVGNHISLWRIESGRSEAARLTGSFYGLWLDPDGDLWATTRDGPVLLPRDGEPVTAVDWTDRVLVGTALQVDRAGLVWLGSERGVVRLGPWSEVKARMLGGRPLAAEVVPLESPTRSMLVDDDGTVWVGTNAAGLRRATARPFSRVALPDDIRGYTTGPLARAGGRTWVSLDCDNVIATDGQDWLDRVDVDRSNVPPDGTRCVHSIAGTADGTLFVGLPSGVYRVRGEDWSPVAFRDQGLSAGAYPSLIEVDRKNRLWVGTSSGDLFRGTVDGAVPLEQLELPAHGARVLSRLELGDGRLVIGTDDGLWIQESTGWMQADCAAGFACGPVRDLMRSTDGVVWAATYGGGLGWFYNGEVGRITPSDHRLADGFLSSVVEAPAGTLWLHGNRGLFSLGLAELAAARAGDIQALQAHRFDVGEANGWARPSARLDDDGTLWLVTVDGLVAFSTRGFEESWTPVRVAVDGVKVGAVTLEHRPGAPIEVDPALGSSLEVRVSAPVLRPDQVARFEYRVFPATGGRVDVPFSEPMARTTLVVSGLDLGTHRFEVRAVGADEARGPTTRLDIEVARAWHAHPALVPGLALFCFALAGAATIYRLRVVEARTRRLAREVAERKQAEQRLGVQRRFYRQVFDSAGFALLLFDGRGVCIEVNKEACTLFGVERSDLLTWTPAHLGLETSRGDGRPGRCRRPDGSSFPARLVTASFVADGERSFLVSVTDLSSVLAERAERERRRIDIWLQHQRALLRRQVGHRLSGLEALQGTDDSAASVAQGQAAVRRAIDALVDRSPSPSNVLPSLDVEPVGRAAEDALRAVLPDGVELVMSVEEGTRVALSRVDLETLLIELGIRAGTSMAQGGRIHMAIERADPWVEVVLRRQPTAGGPTPSSLLLDPGASASPLGGVPELVEAVGGTWAVDAQDPWRSSITVRLPQATLRRIPPAPDRSLRRSRDVHICVVDDNAHVLRAVQVPLELAGFRITAFDDPVRAVAWGRSVERAPELLVTDVVMPNMTGRQLADAMRRVFPDLQVLFVSGYTDDVVLRRGVDGAVENLLVKPFSKQDLLARVEELLVRHAAVSGASDH